MYTARMPFVLISFPFAEVGWAEAKCQLCGSLVYEQPENLERLQRPEDILICVACAVAMKAANPELFPTVDAQLWEGHVRNPEPAPGNRPVIDFLNRKTKR